ncbi:hypothetical protein ZWY2020_001576 [Hordeum vulgare]|nr:hypothetical protein ZWY2020_001576 [Hordeum vulgare]
MGCPWSSTLAPRARASPSSSSCLSVQPAPLAGRRPGLQWLHGGYFGAGGGGRHGDHSPYPPIPVFAAEEEVSVGMEVCPASSPRSPGVVCYSRSPGSPPSPTLGSPDPRPPMAVDPGCDPESPPVPRSRPREGASPVVAARQSARISQS